MLYATELLRDLFVMVYNYLRPLQLNICDDYVDLQTDSVCNDFERASVIRPLFWVCFWLNRVLCGLRF